MNFNVLKIKIKKFLDFFVKPKIKIKNIKNSSIKIVIDDKTIVDKKYE